MQVNFLSRRSCHGECRHRGNKSGHHDGKKAAGPQEFLMLKYKQTCEPSEFLSRLFFHDTMRGLSGQLDCLDEQAAVQMASEPRTGCRALKACHLPERAQRDLMDRAYIEVM